MEFPRQLTWKSSIARRSGSKATHIHAGVPPRFTIVSSTNMRCTPLGSAPIDLRTGPSLCTHLHIDTWLLLARSLRDLAARLSKRPEKYR
ncbi:MAG: hypothetical protein RXR82_05600 [Nitrososphaeria archaeon]